MSTPDTSDEDHRPAPQPKVAPESLELRAQPRRVTRLNPRALAVVIGSMATLVLGAMLWSLQPRPPRQGTSPSELYNVERIVPAEALGQLPSDYSQLPPPKAPELGPPLPGDLGSAIIRTEQQTQGPDLSLDAIDQAEGERLARQKEAEEAALSPVFFRSIGSPGHQSSPAQQMADTPNMDAGSLIAQRPIGSDSSGQRDRNEAFLNISSNTQTRNSGFLEMPESPYQVMAGTVIAAALVTGIKSDLPGDVIATVTEPVYDSATGAHLLIPQGSRLLGRYNSQVSYGQQRVQVAWQRVILPDTSSFQLDSLVGTDAAGFGVLDGWVRTLQD